MIFFCYHLQLRQTRPERKNKNKVCSQTLWLAISLHLNHAVEDQTFWPLLWGKTAQTREAELKGGIDQQQLLQRRKISKQFYGTAFSRLISKNSYFDNEQKVLRIKKKINISYFSIKFRVLFVQLKCKIVIIFFNVKILLVLS